MRKILLFVLVILLALPISARSFSFTYAGQTLTYNVLDEEAKTCEVASVANCPVNLIIPSKVYDASTSVDMTVTGIRDRAFFYESSLTTVSIPTTIQTIGNGAFNSCSNLSSLTISELPNLKKIGEEAFRNCSKLRGTLSFPALTEMGQSAFYDCESITAVSLSSDLKEIPPHAFERCTSLKKIDIPSEVSKIGDNAFYYCSQLANPLVLSALTEMGQYAFAYCESLSSVTIGSNLEIIPPHAFDRCSKLVSITLPANLIEIGEYAFDTCGFSDIELPNSLRKIGRCGFLYSNLENVVIPQGCVDIGTTAFQYCMKLKNVSLPSALTSLPNFIFNGCSQLTSINLPNSILSIGQKAFGNAVRLKEISVPKSVTSIGVEAFYNCPSLIAINIYSENFLTIDESVFGVMRGGPTDGIYPKDIRPTAILKVPSNLYNKYKSDLVWGKFVHIEPLSYPIIESISLSNSEISMIEGDYASIEATDNNNEIIKNGLHWTSSNESVATVNSNGLVTAVGLGEATITCQWTAPSGSVLTQTASVKVKDYCLRIKMPNGNTELWGAAHNSYQFHFVGESGYSLHQVLLDGEDVTWDAEVTGNFWYTIPPARKDRDLYVVYYPDTFTGEKNVGTTSPNNIRLRLAKGHITVEGAGPGAEIKIYDTTGRVIKNTRQNSFDVDVTGVLFLEVEGKMFKFTL